MKEAHNLSGQCSTELNVIGLWQYVTINLRPLRPSLLNENRHGGYGRDEN